MPLTRWLDNAPPGKPRRRKVGQFGPPWSRHAPNRGAHAERVLNAAKSLMDMAPLRRTVNIARFLLEGSRT